MVHPSSKKVLLAALTASFVLQSGLVYTDDTDLALSDEAVRGRKLYHDGSCQVCHQLWGQGGFLGPDLTNAASRVDSTRLVSLLRVGSGQMPAFGYDDREVAQMSAFLTEIDRPEIGRGQLRLGRPGASASPQAAFEAAAASASMPADVADGFEAYRSGLCSSCHTPFATSPVGAPDLSTAVERLDEHELTQVLTDGRPLSGMPPPYPALSERQIGQMVAWFAWLNENRTEMRAEMERRRAGRSVDWSRLPWWEYR